MVVDTGLLFARLLSTLRIDVICDVGSLDGADALRFRAAAPTARIFAFEPHPENFARMRDSAALRQSGIETVPLAASDSNGSADFFAVREGYMPTPLWRGMSSLHRRVIRPEELGQLRVQTARLDAFLANRLPAKSRLALWLDVEGKASEVIEGARGVLDRTALLHVEVETSRCIGADQKLYSQVLEQLRAAGFIELATDNARDKVQFNALFVAGGLRWRTAPQLAAARIRRLHQVSSRILTRSLKFQRPA